MDGVKPAVEAQFQTMLPEHLDAVLAVFKQQGFDAACVVGEITPATDGAKLVLR